MNDYFAICGNSNMAKPAWLALELSYSHVCLSQAVATLGRAVKPQVGVQTDGAVGVLYACTVG
jgi:hypothetical protein